MRSISFAFTINLDYEYNFGRSFITSLISMKGYKYITMLESVHTTGSTNDVSEDKKRIVKNLYLSNIAEEFVAMQVDLEIPVVISILKELDVYRGQITYEDD
jgi:hypothetical protein